MRNRLTFRAQEFCRHYVQGMPATGAALQAGYPKQCASKAAARLMQNPLVEARILRLRGEKLIRRSDLEYMRERTLLLIEGTLDGKLLLSTMRFLAKLDAHVTHPLDDEQRLKEAEQRIAQAKAKDLSAMQPSPEQTNQPGININTNSDTDTATEIDIEMPVPASQTTDKQSDNIETTTSPAPLQPRSAVIYQKGNYRPISHWAKKPLAPPISHHELQPA